MINWTIKIQSPILTTGMSFQVKYRKLPSTVWVSFSPNPTTNEFTITNLENGDYEAEIRTVCTNGELSNPIYHSNAAGQICPVVTDLICRENFVDQSSYMYRSFTFSWTRQVGLMYRLEFQKDGVSAGFNDNASGINSNVPVTIYGLNIDKVRVITICPNGEVPSDWFDVPAYSNGNIYITNKTDPNEEGSCEYTLHVENEPFVGYLILSGVREYNIRNVKMYSHYYANNDPVEFTVPNSTEYGTTAYSSPSQITIPVGVYPNCLLLLYGMPNLVGTHPASATCQISYSPTISFEDGAVFVDAIRVVPADTQV